MTERVTGKVAKVVSAREIIINRGASNGVEVGMIFKVLDRDLTDIVDPDTGESIGEVKRVKVVVKVADVAERLCVARTYRKRRVNVGGKLEGMSALERAFSPPKYEWRYETLEMRRGEEPLDPDRAVVGVGDPVESLLPDEEDDIATIAAWS